MEIPRQVKEEAAKYGSVVTFERVVGDTTVYSITSGDMSIPTGLPVLALFKDGDVKIVSGVKALYWLRL